MEEMKRKNNDIHFIIIVISHLLQYQFIPTFVSSFVLLRNWENSVLCFNFYGEDQCLIYINVFMNFNVVKNKLPIYILAYKI